MNNKTKELKTNTEVANPLEPIVRHLTTSKGENINTGDALHIGTDDNGHYFIVKADIDNPANSQAAEDLIGPNIYWNQKTGKVFNA